MMDDDAMAQNPARPDPNLRRADRDEVFLRTTMSHGRRSEIAGQLVNISAQGFMVRTLESFAADDRIRILLPLAGDVPATVAWALGGRLGCAFDTPFDEKLYRRLLAAIRSARPNWHLA